MDRGVISHTFKDKKLCEDRCVDMISNLPEYVLYHILSFLSTIDVIRLSVISRRCQYLWKSIPNIDLEDKTNRRKKVDLCIPPYGTTVWNFKDIIQQSKPDTKCLELVNRVLTLHDASDIKKLRLQLCVPNKFPDLNLWLQIAINHNIEEIDLTIRCRTQKTLPCCLFTSQSLFVLKISAKLTFNPPVFTCLLNLKQLSLRRVTFSDDSSIHHLFSGCPVLAELVLKECNLYRIKNFVISIPTLKSLTIESVFKCMIQVSSINLNYLNFSSNEEANICVDDLPSLNGAYVNIPRPKELIDGFAYRSRRLFSGLYNVKVLRITYEVLLSIIHVSDIWDHIPTFYKLIHLEVSRVDFPCYNELMKFVMKTPKLEHLDLLQGIYNEEVCEMLEMVPSCFHSSLKMFSISNFAGTYAEMELVSFVLRKATVLQSMIIYYRRRNLSKNKEWLEVVSNQLCVLPKLSKSCVIELRDSVYDTGSVFLRQHLGVDK